MKKIPVIISFILIVVILIQPTSIIVNAENESAYDSINISKEELDWVLNTAPEFKESDTIIKMYSYWSNEYEDYTFIGTFLYGFAYEHDANIHSIINNDGSEILYFAIQEDGNTVFKCYYPADNKRPNPTLGSFTSDVEHPDVNFVKYALYPELVFDPSIEVQNIYYFHGPLSWDSPTIYYVTKEGDFLLTQPLDFIDKR